MRNRWMVLLVLVGLVVFFGVERIYAEGGKSNTPAKPNADAKKPTTGEKKQPEGGYQWWGYDKKNTGNGDNRDDAKSGKIDRLGDGNSGQGNDKNKREDIRDRREDKKDRREDIRDRLEDRKDKREDIRDRRNDGGARDRTEDIRDRREDRKDRREDARDRREDRKDKREDVKERRENKKEDEFVKHCPTCRCGTIRKPRGGGKQKIQPLLPLGGGEKKGNDGVRDHGKGEGRDGAGQGKGKGPEGDKPNKVEKPKKDNERSSNEGVRDYGKGEDREGDGQGKGQGDDNKSDKEKDKEKDK